MKNKNLQSGFAPLLIIAIVAILAIGGGAYVAKKNKEKKMELQDNVETQANANADANANANANLGINANAKGTLRSLLALGKNTMCTFTSTAGGVTSSGTTYIKADGSMSGDFSSQTSSGTITSHMIMTGGMTYVWSGTKGAKMDVSAMGSASAKTSTNQSVDLDSQVDYKCSDWTVDSTKFVVPTNVTFTDINAMLKLQGSGGINLPKY